MSQVAYETGGCISPPASAARAARRVMSVAVDLYLWEVLVATRLGWSMQTFRRLVVAAGLLTLGVGTIAAGLVGSALRGLDDPALSAAVVAAGALIVSYLAVIQIGREALMPMSPIAPADARYDFVRALELSPRIVGLVYGAMPRAAASILGSAVLLAVAWPVRSQIPLSTWDLATLGLLPLALGVAGALWSVVVVAVAAPKGLPRPGTFAVLGVASALVGVATGRIGVVIAQDRPVLVGRSVVASADEILLGVALFAIMGLALLRRVHPGRIAARHRRRVPLPDALVGMEFYFALVRQVIVHPTFAAIRNTVIGAACALLGLASAGAAGWDFAIHSIQIQTAVIGVLSVTVLTLTEALSRSVGPVRLAQTCRTLWELGWDRRALIVPLIGTYLVPMISSALLSTSLLRVLSGQWSALPILVHIVGLGAWLLAECLVPPLRHADGSAMYNVVTAVVTMSLMAPVVMANLWDPAVAFPLEVLYCLSLFGGALWLLSKYILVLPSSSRT